MSEPEKIANNTRYVCDKCRNVVIFPEILASEFPIRFSCTHCDQEYLWQGILILPKVDPMKARSANAQPIKLISKVAANNLAVPETKSEVAEVKKKALDNLLGIKEVTRISADIFEEEAGERKAVIQKSFRSHAESIDGSILDTLESIKAMQADLDTLAAQVMKQFKAEKDFSKLSAMNWNPEFFANFVRFPLTATEVECSNLRIAPYCKYIFSPLFYHPHLGFPLYTCGSFYLELACPYTRLAYPISNIFCQQIKVPNNIHLLVKGNKIFGRSLKYCYNDIDGARHDEDHTDDHVSIFIHDKLAVYRWFVDHGANPWSANPIANVPLRLMHQNREEIEDLLRSLESHHKAWQIFSEYGRLLLCWFDHGQCIQFCTLISMLFQIQKVVVLGDGMYRQAWVDCRAGSKVKQNEFIFATEKEIQQIEHDKLNQIQLLIIDYRSGVSLEFMKRLVHYTGRIIVVGPEDIGVNILEDNTEASILSAVTGNLVIDNIDGRSYEWKKEKLPRQSPLQGFISKISKIKADIRKRGVNSREAIHPSICESALDE